MFLASILCYKVILKIYNAQYLVLVWYHTAFLGIWQSKNPNFKKLNCKLACNCYHFNIVVLILQQ